MFPPFSLPARRKRLGVKVEGTGQEGTFWTTEGGENRGHPPVFAFSNHRTAKNSPRRSGRNGPRGNLLDKRRKRNPRTLPPGRLILSEDPSPERMGPKCMGVCHFFRPAEGIADTHSAEHLLPPAQQRVLGLKPKRAGTGKRKARTPIGSHTFRPPPPSKGSSAGSRSGQARGCGVKIADTHFFLDESQKNRGHPLVPTPFPPRAGKKARRRSGRNRPRGNLLDNRRRRNPGTLPPVRKPQTPIGSRIGNRRHPPVAQENRNRGHS